MGVYIAGMEMPRNCESCPCKTADAFGGLGCQATGYIPLRQANQDRPDNCPLVPVPPHGALMDRAELWVEINKICDRRDAGIITDLMCLQQILSALRHAPTIIPAEEGE